MHHEVMWGKGKDGASYLRTRLPGTLIVASRSPSSKPFDHFNEFLPLLETVLNLVLLRLIPATHLGKLRGGLQLAWKADLASSEQFAMRVFRCGIAWPRRDDLAQELDKLLAA
jgi:hypothetical protein